MVHQVWLAIVDRVRTKLTDNSRNGYSQKTVKSNYGKVDLDVPRVRNGQFEPLVVKKNQSDISSIEDQVLSMYAKGMSTRDMGK
jgi:putative transposase